MRIEILRRDYYSAVMNTVGFTQDEKTIQLSELRFLMSTLDRKNNINKRKNYNFSYMEEINGGNFRSHLLRMPMTKCTRGEIKQIGTSRKWWI